MIKEYKKNEETFKYLISTLKDSIKGWDYFINWKKVYENVRELEIELNLMNYLIGKNNIEEECRYLIRKHPEVIRLIPILIASRDDEFKILSKIDVNKYSKKEYSFNKIESLTEDDIEKVVEFMRESGILVVFENKSIKNIVDYVFGIEVGLDSNGRKNRSGHAMEDIVEDYVSLLCDKYGYEYLKEATPNVIKTKWNIEVTVDKASRRFDFVINKNGKLYLIETNYYGGGGSKLKATAGEYKTLYDVATKDGHEFIWITDGLGWLTASKPLEETFYHNKYILNLHMLECSVLDEILKI
ncbi:type II restriction endonuclease [Clostridium sp.]|uniref:type II restriction endonuclease n=1 Tax=Clostridium sp. TaxID=1506 RepID=UPI002904CEA9|nr:type II restriction endonuclease [Clostridium sp.]MDU2458719.1 type II restriction endonuclease [Clostridium sp.]MDU7363375.1 type II restriction endonuclease [Clostridium sp.]